MKIFTITLVMIFGFLSQIFAQTIQYQYDDLGRMNKATYANGNSITYNYDVLGNRTSVVVSGTSCQAATATLSGTQNINAGQSANLSVSFAGDGPRTLVFNGQTYTDVIDNPFTIPVSPTATTIYTLTSVSNDCGAGTVSGSAVVTVNGGCTPPQPPTVSSATINSGQTATLTSSGCSGTVYWYGYPSGGNAFLEGASITTPVLGATTTYYASCVVGGCTSTTRGSGTVTVNPASSCPVPTGMQWSNTTATSFLPRCTNIVGYSYVFRYRPSGTTTWTETAPVSDQVNGSVATIFTGLTNGTSYEWQVKTICGPGNESAYSSSTYSSTFCQPANLGSSNSVLVFNNSVTFNWGNFGIPLNANLRWRVVGTTTWITANDIANDTYSATGLTPGTNYEVQIQTICADGSLSPFSTGRTFTTSNCTPPQPPTVSSATINSGQTATLTANGCSGTVNWHSAASGGTSLNSGTSFTTPTLTTTTTFYASCTVNNCVSTSRGSGEVTVNSTVIGEIFSVKTGSWHDPATWDCNCIPNNTHTVEIKANHTVTVSTADANLKDLKFSDGNLNFQNQKQLCFGCN